MALDNKNPQQNPDEALSKIFGFLEKLAPMLGGMGLASPMGGGMGLASPMGRGIGFGPPPTMGLGGLFGAGLGGQSMLPPGIQGGGFQGMPQNPDVFTVRNPMSGGNLVARYNPKQDTYSVINPRTKRPVTFTKEQFEKRFGRNTGGRGQQFAAWGQPGGFDAIEAGGDVAKMLGEIGELFGGGGGAKKQQSQQQEQTQPQPASPQTTPQLEQAEAATKIGKGQELYNLVKDAVMEGLKSMKLRLDDDTVSVIA